MLISFFSFKFRLQTIKKKEQSCFWEELIYEKLFISRIEKSVFFF